MNAFVAGSGVGVRTGGERRGVCVRKRARWVNRRGVVTAVVEPAQKEAVEKKAVEKEVDVVEEQGNGVVPPEVPLIVPKRTTFAGLVYDRLQDTGADIPQQVGRLVTKPQLKKDVKRPRLVILGSGWASHSFAKVVDAVKYDVVIVSPRNYFLFTPMLASTAVGTIEFRSIVEPIRKANEFIDYFEATCLGINAQDQVIKCESVQKLEGESNVFDIPYDYLIVGVGASTNTFGIPGVEENCFFLKEIENARELRKGVITRFERANLPSTPVEEKKRLLSFVVVGGGPTGVEYAAELHDLVTEDMSKKYSKLIEHFTVTLVQRQNTILTQFDGVLQQSAMDNFKQSGINVITGADVVEVTPTAIHLKDGRELPQGMTLWAAGNGTQTLVQDLLNSIPEQAEARGRLIVDDWLRVKGAENVFAFGDCAAMESGALPPTAQVAGQQGAYLGRLFNRDYCLECELPYATAKPNSNVETIGMTSLAKPFQFLSLGIMAYIGEEKSMIQFEAGDNKLKLSGALTYLLWQSVYATKQVSFRSRVLVLFDWFKTKVFGRDLSQF
uniref:FAD/NAD(P)-binding domain-containing protein n=3 Tax=Rhodosorus marinus TaxID=101924 RepID=A0A7S3E771_9RHOD|mmetsp:Transcript_13471/g.53987  ORF Transcript_13471/g.53987 Transcript_13471/m.53987 type:complete len:556 (+) Transcript_13471:604-2271(+)